MLTCFSSSFVAFAHRVYGILALDCHLSVISGCLTHGQFDMASRDQYEQAVRDAYLAMDNESEGLICRLELQNIITELFGKPVPWDVIDVSIVNQVLLFSNSDSSTLLQGHYFHVCRSAPEITIFFTLKYM